MNFVAGTLSEGSLELGPSRFEVPEAVRARLRSREGAVLAGLRPEHFKDAGLAEDDGATVPADVEITEQLGPETYVYFRIPGSRRPRSASDRSSWPEPSPPGWIPLGRGARRRLTLPLDLDGVQLFDAESGDSILGD